MALALVLLVGAGLLMRSFARLRSVALGVRPSGVMTFAVNLPQGSYGDAEQRARFHRDYEARLAALPGVRTAGAISRLPVTGSYHSWGVRRADLAVRAGLTGRLGSSILRSVSIVIRRLSAVLLAAGLLAGNAAVCAGWLATPEARMACCSGGHECPMHKGESHHSGEARVLSQAQADACCAAPERQPSSPSAPSFITVISSAVLGAGIVIPMPVPALVASNAWRVVAPVPIASVPKHVLLSVFLV